MRVLKYRQTDRMRAVSRKRHQDNAARTPIHVSRGDTVRVMRGDDKGKEGKVVRVFTKTGRIIVEGVNIVKKHQRARRPEEESGIIEKPAPIHASNVMLLDPKSGEPTRTRTRIDEDAGESKLSRRKERVSAKSGDAIPRSR
jgi:large subunit ribosomal protein L24